MDYREKAKKEMENHLNRIEWEANLNDMAKEILDVRPQFPLVYIHEKSLANSQLLEKDNGYLHEIFLYLCNSDIHSTTVLKINDFVSKIFIQRNQMNKFKKKEFIKLVEALLEPLPETNKEKCLKVISEGLDSLDLIVIGRILFFVVNLRFIVSEVKRLYEFLDEGKGARALRSEDFLALFEEIYLERKATYSQFKILEKINKFSELRFTFTLDEIINHICEDFFKFSV